MNKAWSELNNAFQAQIKKEASFRSGIETLLNLRNEMFRIILSFKKNLSRNDFDAMPYVNARGYHSKTIAYSVWHIFRIEDIVSHTLINGDGQIFFIGGYQKRINSPIITTGNELAKYQIAEFSKQLNLEELYSYISEVKESTESIISRLNYASLKNHIPEERKQNLIALNVVSNDENAKWLIDYWCGKDIYGLIKMPFSRHWIMHTEASLRIKTGIKGNI